MITSFKRRQKIISKEKEIEKNHKKNVRNKLREEYENFFTNRGLRLHKININFIPTIIKSKKVTFIEPISCLPNIAFVPYLYICSEYTFSNEKIKNREKEAITPKTLIESIIFPYYQTTGGDFREVNMVRGNEPFKYFLKDSKGFNIYIKLHKKKENELFFRKKETKSVVRYRKNKEVYDEMLFNDYMKQFSRELKIFKKKYNGNDFPIFEVKIETPNNLEFCMMKKGSLCGLVFQRKDTDGRYNPILYSHVQENADLKNIDAKIYMFLNKSSQAENIDTSVLDSIPLINDNFDDQYFKIFKNKFDELIRHYQQEV